MYLNIDAQSDYYFLCGQYAQWGRTALIHAAELGHLDCARLLLDAGAVKEAKDNVRASVRDNVFSCLLCFEVGVAVSAAWY